jgi:hypothetical protein
MNWPWRSSLSWEEIGTGVTLGVVLIVILIATAAFYAKFPYPCEASSNWGLGAGWKFAQTQQSEPVCIKGNSN